ncbi:hypothetical protein ACS0TY_006044 [Phlomoides rotata]
MNEREGDLKQENTGDHHINANKMASSSSTTASWSRFKDPRIVRVSRAFGGKDRHSKVCTVRGLRDRRVRLSVPTAIQLYDLQDRLGLNQPSKVVDWLLNAAKQEIEGLPPLQFPILTPNHGFIMPSQAAKQGLKISGDFSWNDPYKHNNPRVFSDGNEDHGPQQNPSSSSSSSFSSLLSSNTMAPFNSWDPSNLTLSQPPITAQHDQDLDNFALGPHHHHLVYQQTQPYLAFPTNAGFDSKQPGFHISELSNSSAQPVRPFRFSLTADLLHPASQNKHDELNSSS